MHAARRAGKLGVTAALVVALAGCGGGDDKKDEAKKPAPAAAEEAPAQAPESSGGDPAEEAKDARTNARNAVTLVETCYADQMDYGACADGQVLSDGGLEAGTEVGQVEVTDATPTTYTVNTYLSDESWFSIEKAEDGTTTRSCDAPAEAGCEDGSW